ncbi:hypothetical protein HMSSN036_19070 [Paenibacillus macerans]|nr:hypothetical protein HMSSN036_19070 [Paenibacillus macerans]
MAMRKSDALEVLRSGMYSKSLEYDGLTLKFLGKSAEGHLMAQPNNQINIHCPNALHNYPV